MRADAADFELLRVLGQVSYNTVETSAERTLKWSGGEDGGVPDSLSVSGSLGVSQGDAVMKLYAGKVVGWDDGKLKRSNAIPDVLLKEYVNAAAFPMADNEVTAYQTLYSDPTDSTIGQTKDGLPRGQAFDPASLPVVPLVAFFQSKRLGSGESSEEASSSADGRSLWTVQAWGEGGVTRLTDYPSKRQEMYEAKWWPPVQRARDAGLGPRMRFVRNCVVGIYAAVDSIHKRNVAHNAIDSTSFQINTLNDKDADEVEVRLMNFGFASVGLTEENRRNDLRACAIVVAEFVFSSLSKRGPGANTDAESLRRLFEDVFLLNEKDARGYCLEEPDFESVVEFFEYRDRQGDGWQLLVDCWRGETTAGEILARAETIETPYD